MREKVRSHSSQIPVAVLEVIIGLLCLIYPDQTTNVIARLIGIAILIVGIVMMVSRIREEQMRVPAIILGALIAVIGLFILTHPGVKELVFIVFGVLLLADSVSGITASVAIRAAGTDRWMISMILAIVSMILGIICILCATSLLNFGFRLIGIFMIYDGVTSVYSTIKASHAQQDIIDV